MLCKQNVQDQTSQRTNLNLCKTHCTIHKTVFCCNVLRNGFRWSAFASRKLTSAAVKKLHKNNARKVFHMQTQENIREGKVYFQNYSISVSQSSVDATEKSEPIEKITLYIFSRGYITPWPDTCYLFLVKVNSSQQNVWG